MRDRNHSDLQSSNYGVKQHRCDVKNKANIKCNGVCGNGVYVSMFRIHAKDETSYTIIQHSFELPDYFNGTLPLQDVFWYWGGHMQIYAAFEPKWTGICVQNM